MSECGKRNVLELYNLGVNFCMLRAQRVVSADSRTRSLGPVVHAHANAHARIIAGLKLKE